MITQLPDYERRGSVLPTGKVDDADEDRNRRRHQRATVTTTHQMEDVGRSCRGDDAIVCQGAAKQDQL